MSGGGIINLMLEKTGIICSFSIGPYNKYDDKEQWIRISEGCPNGCPYCYEPKKEVIHGIPEIVRNDVKIMDMNLLSKMPQALDIIRILGNRRVNNRVVYYELVCGVDYRFMTQEISDALKKSRFRQIRIAWDLSYNLQFKIKSTINMLIKSGYKQKDLMLFMICNWEISYQECLKKLYLCAVWGVKVSDCYFDGQKMPEVIPLGWTLEQIYDFRKRVRKHNQLVSFGIDPEIKNDPHQKKLFSDE